MIELELLISFTYSVFIGYQLGYLTLVKICLVVDKLKRKKNKKEVKISEEAI